MKKFFLVTAIAALSVFIIGISSCEKPAPNKAFVGSYTVNGSCVDGTVLGPVPIIISAGSSNTSIVINFAGRISLNATVSGSNFTIADQYITDSSGNVWDYNGTGSVTGSFLTLTYNAVTTNDESHCTVTGTR